MASSVTTDIEELEARWAALYLNLMILRSSDPIKNEMLKAFHEKLVEFHSEITALFTELKK